MSIRLSDKMEQEHPLTIAKVSTGYETLEEHLIPAIFSDYKLGSSNTTLFLK